MSLFKSTGVTYDTRGRRLLHTPNSDLGHNELFVIGDEFTDGSIRFALDDGETIANIEKRTDGVFNDTSLRFSSDSVYVGRDLRVEATADFIKTVNPSGFSEHSTALVPHIPFNDVGTQQLHTAIAGGLADVVVFSGAVSQKSASIISQALTLITDQFIKTIKYETGTVAASHSVIHTIYQGTDNTGSVIEKRTIVSTDFAVSTTVTVNVESAIGFSVQHANIFIEMVSTASFSLKTDVSNNILLTLSSQPADIVGVFTENIIYDNSFDHVLDNSLDPVYGNQF